MKLRKYHDREVEGHEHLARDLRVLVALEQRQERDDGLLLELVHVLAVAQRVVVLRPPHTTIDQYIICYAARGVEVQVSPEAPAPSWRTRRAWCASAPPDSRRTDLEAAHTNRSERSAHQRHTALWESQVAMPCVP
jgi:hypothetical protein